MTTPIIMVVLLVCPVVLGKPMAAALGRSGVSVPALAAIGLALVFAFTGTGHFVKTQGMVEMLPPWLPMREPAVWLSGIFEWSLAVALLVPRLRRATAWAAAAFLLGVLPVNIWAALNSTGLGGHQWGPVYLWIRVPLQLLLVAWCWLAARPERSSHPELK